MGRKVEIAAVQGPVEAELVRGILESYGIAAELATSLPHSVFPFLYEESGRVGILVLEEEAMAAQELIASHRQSGLVMLSGDRTPRDVS